MAKRSKFFNAMACFFTNNQGGKQLKKKSSAQKSKSKRKHDVLAIDQVPQIISKPKRHLQISTAKPKTIVETIDLTNDETDAIFPMKIQVIDETNNVGPFLIHIKTDPTEPTDTCFNGFTSQFSCPEKYIKTEETTNSNSVIILKNEDIIEDSILIDNMSVENSNEPLRKDAALLNQYHNYDNVDLSRNENKTTSRINDQTDKEEAKSVKDLQKSKPKIEGHSTSTNSSERKAEKYKRKNARLLASKVITLKECGTYCCTLCDVTFKSKRRIVPHVKSHKKAKFEYRCSVCDQLFQWKRYLIRHLKEHFVTSDFEQSIGSEEAKKKSGSESESTTTSLLNKTTVDDHETFNNLEKKLKLNNNSTHASFIKLISDTDRTKLNLTCAYCDQCFDSQISLVEHCRTHMADQPFICNVCGTLFKQNAALVYHTRTHFRMMRNKKKGTTAPYIKYVLKLHSCKDCDRSYVSWPALNQHRVDVHGATEDSFTCNICQAVFNSFGRLNAHQDRKICKKSQTQKHRVKCEICTKTFSKKYIKDHMLKIHPNE